MAHDIEMSEGKRFAFGENWSRFLASLSDEKITKAEDSLKTMLQVESLAGKRFLDIGCGSGLFSLAARRLGASVHSFDYDPRSVACTQELKNQFFAKDTLWTIEEASILDDEYVTKLGTFDVVYSWGVLHHTGEMYTGFESALACVAPEGRLYIAIYNDQGWKSHFWWFVKMLYNKLPNPINRMYGYFLGGLMQFFLILKYTIKLQPMQAIRPLIEKKRRGMSVNHDMIDWMGGFPFEFASYDVLSRYFQIRGCKLVKGKPASSLGCHELIFQYVGRENRKNCTS